MAKEPKRVKVESDSDIIAVLEELNADKEPRVLEMAGEDVAVVLSPDDYVSLVGEPKSKRNKERLLALAGAWKDLDTDALVDNIYRWRHESPPSPAVEL
jgi:hypothetical protein